MFACEHYDLEPDLITMAKSLGGGLPLSAVTGRAEILVGGRERRDEPASCLPTN